MAFVDELQELADEGFVRTQRDGDTGVGKTFEDYIGVDENNRQGPDYQGIELKATRKDSSCAVTLFTREPPTSSRRVWNEDLIRRVGYEDTNERPALKVTLRPNCTNQQGLRLRVDGRSISVVQEDIGVVASYPLTYIREAAQEKLPELVLVLAETRDGEQESFWYNEAYHLSSFDIDAFVDHIRQGDILVDLRMHLRADGSLRNHGTAWRLQEEDTLHALYDDIRPLLSDEASVSSIADARGWRQAGLNEY